MLAHFREFRFIVYFDEGVGADLINQILSNPLGLTELESWMLFGVGMLFATITLVDVITFSDIYPGYTKVQKKWDEFTDGYKDEYDALKEELDDIKEEYADVLKEIGNSLSARLQHLDHIMSGAFSTAGSVRWAPRTTSTSC